MGACGQFNRCDGFTLIEMSIVLVIIGLIVGGVLVGQSLIEAAAIRAQITQIEKYQMAVNTFRGKYGELPGDISANAVSLFGFTAAPTRAGTVGMGDGNGELDGGGFRWGMNGENAFFWEDLSANSGLIEGNFSAYNGGGVECYTFTQCSAYYPPAKIGRNNSVYVWSVDLNGCPTNTGCGVNFFSMSIITVSGSNLSAGPVLPAPGLTVAEAYAIDNKIDDGLPETGNVLAFAGLGFSGQANWAANAGSASATTCFDNSSGRYAYSIAYNGGAGINCVLSFKFQ
jgi:prepilin-type N-terminal cleavage/methylation domain-containing protein